MRVANEARAMLEARLEELQPYIDEADEIREMLVTLDGQRTRTRKRLPLSQRRAAILKAVEEQPGIRITQLAGGLGVSVPRAVQIINQLEARGDVRRTKEGLALGELR